jgi:hypothetical protein
MSLTESTTSGNNPDQVSRIRPAIQRACSPLTTCEVVFPKTKVTVHWSIFGGVSQDLEVNASAGTADNGFQNFWVYKDTGTFLYSVDGWRCDSMFFAF